MNADVSFLMLAANFAAKKHMNQRRNNELDEPYINHPISLANLLCNELDGLHIDTSIVVAALLHDTIEDTKTTHEEIADIFGNRVLQIVLEVSDDKSLPKKTRKRLQIEQAKSLSYDARIVKLADKICNLRDMVISPISVMSNEKIVEYFDWSKAVIDEIRGTHSMLEMLFDEAYQGRSNFTSN